MTGSHEVEGSIPFSSTISLHALAGLLARFLFLPRLRKIGKNREFQQPFAGKMQALFPPLFGRGSRESASFRIQLAQQTSELEQLSKMPVDWCRRRSHFLRVIHKLEKSLIDLLNQEIWVLQ